MDLTMNKLRTGPRKPLEKPTPELGIAISGGGQNTESERTAEAAVPGVPTTNSTVDSDPMGIVQPPEDGADPPPTKTDGEDPPPTKTAAVTRVQYGKIRSDFARRNVNAESVTASGLDIFNHLKFGKLLKCVYFYFISGSMLFI